MNRTTLPRESIDFRLELCLPWMLSVSFILVAEGLILRMDLGPQESELIRCVEIASVTLLLAIRGHWVNDRKAFDVVSLCALLPSAWFASRLFSCIFQIAPFALVSLALPSYSSWRYLPDRGQAGGLWPIRSGLRRGALILSASVAVMFLLQDCAPKKEAPPAPRTAIYDLKGEIVTVNAQHHSLVVHHRDIPGYMPSMTMEFPVPDAELGSFKEGQQITAHMVVQANGDLHLEGVRVVDTLKEGILGSSAASLQQDTISRGSIAYRDIGEKTPQFTLLDQDNNVVSIDRFRGKRVVLDFIYTRCPVASMCPASTAKMIQIQSSAKAKGIRNLELVSITLDPDYDTPAVLKNYAKVRGIDTTNFTFLTGPESAVRDLLLAFGVLSERDGNLLKHTLATVLIDEGGVIRYRADGSGWSADEFLDRLEHGAPK